MMVSLFYFTFWAIMRGANFARPSALHRGYVQIWLFITGWAMLVAVTVAEDRLRIGAGYMFVFFQSAIFLSLFIALCELFALPKKAEWAWKMREEQEERHLQRGRSNGDLSPSQLPPPVPHQESTPPGTRHSNSGPAPANQDDDDDAEVPTERTPLVGGTTTDRGRTTFATTYRRSLSAIVNTTRRASDATTSATTSPGEAFDHEQPWSARLPSWTWFLQFLLLGPFTIVLAAQTALMLVDAVHQTGADGSSLLLPYLIVFLGAVLLVLPLAPFVHRVSHHVPVALLVVFAGTLVFNLVREPFGEGARYKVYFVQTLDLDAGSGNRVCYHGVEEFVRPVIAALPSAAGREVVCGESKRKGLVACCFDGEGLEPNLLLGRAEEEESAVGGGDKGLETLVTVNATRTGGNAARIEIAANNTKACFLEFEQPVSGLRVQGSSGWDERFGQYPDAGVKNLRLWHRRWDEPWVVEVEWKDTASAPALNGSEDEEVGSGVGDEELRKRRDGLKGSVACMWSDANIEGTIPALDEALRFVPAWAAVTKFSEGLVEGRKGFEV